MIPANTPVYFPYVFFCVYEEVFLHKWNRTTYRGFYSAFCGTLYQEHVFRVINVFLLKHVYVRTLLHWINTHKNKQPFSYSWPFKKLLTL